MPPSHDPPAGAVASLVSILDLEPLERNLFRGTSPRDGWQRVYGGQVLGQALVAAARTVDGERPAHSLHAYFLLPGDPHNPIVYSVERVRDGGSFSTRRVTAIQHGATMFVMSASFHKAERGFEHAAPMPDVPPPEAVPGAADIVMRHIDRFPEFIRDYWTKERPIEIRPVDMDRYLSREPRPPIQNIWMRANGRLPDDPKLHQCVLAYASDFTLLDTALLAHGKVMFDADIQLASLDHAMWFHQPFRADEWLLFSQESPSASGARGFSQGNVFARNGRLVASITQEGLMRQRASSFMPK